MANREAQYIIDEGESDKDKIIIHDIGQWSSNLTVTNDVENVVRKLARAGYLPPQRRLFYYDSEGELSEIIVRDGEFYHVGYVPQMGD